MNDAIVQADQASIEAEGAERRASRAAQERDRYEAEHARELFDELIPASENVADRMKAGAHELIAAHAEWGTIAQRASELRRHIPRASAHDLPAQHELHELVRELKRTGTNVVPPTRLRQVEAEHEEAA
jgi:hypothetical protein